MISQEWSNLDCKLSTKIISAIKNTGFLTVTPVQNATIPLFLSNKDVSVEACTGSGKTLAFLIPIVEILLRRKVPLLKHQIGAIVISPTRELARQIFNVATEFCKDITEFSILLLTGGVDSLKDAQQFQDHGGNIVVATPGRLEGTMRSLKDFNVRELEVLVLDEADRLLQMGFMKQLNSILSRLPKQRRTGLFSATQSRDVEDLLRAGLRNPVTIEIRSQSKISSDLRQIPHSLQNSFIILKADQKFGFLVRFLKEHRTEKLMIFVLTCACVDYFAKILSRIKTLNGINMFSLHGRMAQKKRNKIYSKFESLLGGGVLICTDLVARGIDFPDVDWILQYDPPQDSSFFVHRVGRTARMGRSGKAIVMLMPNELRYGSVLREMKVLISENRQTVDSEDCKALLQAVKLLCREDRDIMEKGQRAFVSYIRGYKEHRCTTAFQLSELPFGYVATGFGLLYFPRMPDIHECPVPNKSDGSVDGFSPEVDLDISKIKYRDQNREKDRLENFELKQKRKEQEHLDRIKKRKTAEIAKKKAFRERRKRKGSRTRDKRAEWDELAEETRLFKRFKKKKMSKKQFEIAVGERRQIEDEEK